MKLRIISDYADEGILNAEVEDTMKLRIISDYADEGIPVVSWEGGREGEREEERETIYIYTHV
jgi:hypothetical protein